MKKSFVFIFVFSVIISISSLTYCYADTGPYANNAGYLIRKTNNSNSWYIQIYYTNFSGWLESTLQNNNDDNYFKNGSQIASHTYNTYDECISYFNQYILDHPVNEYQFYDNNRYTALDFSGGSSYTYYVYNLPYRYVPSGSTVNDDSEPDDPEPGSSWLSDVWEWFLWQLGINDDYSGDIDIYITGGDRERMELVTPTPSPIPTPRPTLPPFSLDIVDNNGNPVYTITGIPNNTNNYYYSDDHSSGSDFDIFEVDLKIGDGGSTNPRDGLNSVMDTSKDYLSENVDTSLIGDLFSVIPNDWFLFIGVLAALPFIAGFISKLLK